MIVLSTKYFKSLVFKRSRFFLKWNIICEPSSSFCPTMKLILVLNFPILRFSIGFPRNWSFLSRKESSTGAKVELIFPSKWWSKEKWFIADCRALDGSIDSHVMTLLCYMSISLLLCIFWNPFLTAWYDPIGYIAYF